MNSEARCITQGALLSVMLEETALFIENNLEETEPVLECLKKRRYIQITTLKKWYRELLGDQICSKEKLLKN